MSGWQPSLDRRTTLAWAGALAAALGSGEYFALDAAATAGAIGPGYGRDPNLIEPKVPWPRLLTRRQLTVVRLIADFILPREGETPGAVEVGAHELIDEWVSAPYPDQQADRVLLMEGLDWLDLQVRSAGQAADFAAADAGVQAALLGRLADPASDLPVAAFFKRLRRLILGAYYTTEAGFADIGYVGNTPIEQYPAPTPEMLAAMERAYRALGLVDRVSADGWSPALANRPKGI